jgi:hypothetical protein
MSTEIPQDILGQVKELAAASGRTASELKAGAEEAAKVHLLWNDLATCLSKGWYLHARSLLSKGQSSGGVEFPLAAACVEQLQRFTEEQADEILRTFPALLEQASDATGLSLNKAESHHPRYYFDGQFFQLEIDDRRGMARLSDNEGQLGGSFPADIGAIVERVKTEHDRIFGHRFDGVKFLVRLRQQYLAIIKKEKQEDGASIQIRKITHRLGKNKKGFRTDEFLVDLSRLVEQGPTEIEGRRLDLQQTRDTKQGMLLHGAGGRAYVGYILFKRIDHGHPSTVSAGD